MKVSYEYYYTKQAVGQLDIDDIGNCVISANNDDMEYYFLIIKTELGITRVLEYGPSTSYPTYLNSSFMQFDYNDSRIDKMIDKFLNNPKRRISQAAVLDSINDIKELLIDPLNFILPGA